MAVKDHVEFFNGLRSMNDEELFKFFHSLYTMYVMQLIALATGSVALREYLAHMGAEYRTWKLLFQGRIMPARLAILLVRYAYIGAFLTAVYFMFGDPPPEVCDPLYRSIFGLYTVLWGAAGSIFLMRLNIIFARQKAVMALFIFLWSGCIGLWLFVTTRLHAFATPKSAQFPYGPICSTGRFPKLGAIAWAGSIIFDSVVFVAAFIRFRNANKTKIVKTVQLRSRKWIFRSNLYYFGASFFFNAAMLLSALFVTDTILSNLGNSLAFAIHCWVATRLVFNTRGWATSGSADDEEDVILNTFNKNRRHGTNNTLGVTSRITYTVDETVITSTGDLEEGENHHSRHRRRDRNTSHPDYSHSHRSSVRDSNDQDFSQRNGVSKTKMNPKDSREQLRSQSQSDYKPEICSEHVSMPKVSIVGRKKSQDRLQGEHQSTDSLEEKESTSDHQNVSPNDEKSGICRPPNAFLGNSVSQPAHVATIKDQDRIKIEISQPLSGNDTIEESKYTSTYAGQRLRTSNLYYGTSIMNPSPSSDCFDIRPQRSTSPTEQMAGSTSNSPPSPGTLSNPPSYSALDQHIRQAASSSSLCSPTSPATYEIQQAEDFSKRPNRVEL